MGPHPAGFYGEQFFMPHSIIEAVFYHAQQQPERPAIFFEDQVIRYGQLYEDAARFAQALTTWGVQPGDRIALFLENCPAFVVAYLGTHLAGGVVVLVNPQYRQVELSHIMNDAGVQLCVTSVAGAEELQHLAIPTLTALVLVDATDDSSSVGSIEHIAFTDFLKQGTEYHEMKMPALESPALIGYTSGTTGRAKGALLCHRNLIANITAL